MEAEATDELNGLPIREILDADSRPTFILDLDPDEDVPAAGAERPILPIFCNAALRSHEVLFDSLIGHDAQGLTSISTRGKESYEDFKRWATGVTPHDDSKDVFPLAFLYGDLLWTGSTVRQRWRLISGNRLWQAESTSRDLSSVPPPEVVTGLLRSEQSVGAGTRDVCPTPEGLPKEGKHGATRPPKLQAQERVPAPVEPQTDKSTAAVVSNTQTVVASEQQTTDRPPAPRRKPSYLPKASEKSSDDTGGSGQSGSIALSAPDKAVADWTVAKPKGSLSPFVQIARSVDWASTPLGPMDQWSPEFRQLANLLMVS